MWTAGGNKTVLLVPLWSLVPTKLPKRIVPPCQRKIEPNARTALRGVPYTTFDKYNREKLEVLFPVSTRGLPEQESGRVLLNAITQEPGNCYFRDGASEVNRTIEGEYAFCGVADAVCDDAFWGVYRSRDYDPRYRGWYKLAKEVQTVVWSNPYPFFSSLAIGITLNRPIHSVENGRSVFKGVLAVDYSMDQITTFLAEQYAGSEINVLIAEAEEPYYVVASSTGTPGATLVLKEDETQPCSVNENQDQLCNVVRVKIDNFGVNQADKVLMAAFHAQSVAGWPRNELVSVKVTDEPGAEAHASQSELFEQDNANLKWRLIVTMPIDTAANDAALRGENVFAIICLLGGLGFFVCFLLFAIFFSKRHDKAVVHADWRFTSAFILGCAGMNLSTLTMLGENRDQLCMLRMWSFNLLFACGKWSLRWTISAYTLFVDSFASFVSVLLLYSHFTSVCQGVSHVQAVQSKCWFPAS